MRNRVTRPRDRKPSRTVSCSSKLNNVSWMGCSDLVRPDLVPFGSLVYIEMFVGRGKGNGRIVPFLLSRLDHPTSIQDGGRREKKEEKRKGRRKRINFQIDSEIDSPGENRFEISKLKHRGKEGKLRTCWLAGPSNNTRGQVIHRLTRWLLQGGV